MTTIRQIAEQSKVASRLLVQLSGEQRAGGLLAMADALQLAAAQVLAANAEDMTAGKAAGLSAAMLDRLMVDKKRLAAMVQGIRDVAALSEGLGEVIEETPRPNGLLIQKVRVPIGVIVIIYESRPNVTADASALCLRAGNAVVLRGGSESLRTNLAIAQAMQSGGASAGLPANAMQVVPTSDRQVVNELVKMDDLVDLVIPRGGEGLIRAVTEQARVPVIKHYKGVCHIFVDESADQPRALGIIENAKCQRPGVCNAVETILVHEKIAKDFLPLFAARMFSRKVEMRGDEVASKLVPMMKPATEEDWYAEYLDLVVAVRVVKDVHEAIEHINHYGSHHSDSILSKATENQKLFCEAVDSAVVYVNASTRFTDGGEFGMGAEIGISTDKLHARGPMGLKELTTYKYVVQGSGQIRE